MIVFYCDESGTHYKKSPTAMLCKPPAERWYFLGALAVPVRFRKKTHDIVLRLKNQHLCPLAPKGLLYDRSPEAELKGHRLLSRLSGNTCDFPLWNDLSEQAAAEMLATLLSELDCLHGCLFVVAVDQALLYRKMFRIARPAPFIALTFLQQRACAMLESLPQEHRFGVFVLDRGSAVEQEFDVDRFLETRDSISLTAGVRCAYDLFLLENPVSAKSSDVPQMQICDVLLYMIARAIRRGDPGDEWFRRTAPFVTPGRDGRVLGAGMTFYPPEAIPEDWNDIWAPVFAAW
jgi:hypothetical protein